MIPASGQACVSPICLHYPGYGTLYDLGEWAESHVVSCHQEVSWESAQEVPFQKLLHLEGEKKAAVGILVVAKDLSHLVQTGFEFV